MDDDEVIGLVVAMCGGAVLIAIVGYEFGWAEARAHYDPLVENLRDSVDALLPPSVTIMLEDIEPGSLEDLFNRADPGCELCEGAGHVGPASCPCTEVEPCR